MIDALAKTDCIKRNYNKGVLLEDWRLLRSESPVENRFSPTVLEPTHLSNRSPGVPSLSAFNAPHKEYFKLKALKTCNYSGTTRSTQMNVKADVTFNIAMSYSYNSSLKIWSFIHGL